MGAAEQIENIGEKGGGSKPKSPVEASDSLRSTNLAKLLIAVGEGEFDGVPTEYDIYLDNTPIRDASGNYNFPGVKSDWRPGSVNQTYSTPRCRQPGGRQRTDSTLWRILVTTQILAASSTPVGAGVLQTALMSYKLCTRKC